MERTCRKAAGPRQAILPLMSLGLQMQRRAAGAEHEVCPEEFSCLDRHEKTMLLRLLSIALLCICLAASAANQSAPVTGPRLTDAQFFALLDFARPDLATVKAAVEKSDYAAARHAFAQHLRTRTTPRWEMDPKAIGRDRQFRDSGAENALKHRFTSIGIPWQFGQEIDWAFNPTTQPDSKWPRNHEWTWQLSRHAAWLDLARAYYATGDERYAREFVAELRSWVRDCPVPLDAPANVPASRWRTIEAGIRTGSVWPEVFPRFLAAQAFDDEALLLMVKSFVEHAQYLLKFPTRGNWLTMEANGLYHVGALFPEFTDAKQWRETGLNRLYRELDVQVYPDGAQIELAPGYHGVTIRNFLGPVNLTPRTDLPVPPDYLAKMEKMFAYFLDLMQPNRTTPPLNDSGANNIVGYLKEGARLFPQRADFRWAGSEGREGQPPNHTSCVFPYAGQFIMRNGWATDGIWLCMDGGPFGFGHQHEDKLSVMLTAHDRPLLVEGGTYTYDASEWRRYVLSSRAHNVVLVDGLEQNRRKEPKESFVVKEPLPHVWESNDTFDHAAASYEEGWGPQGQRLVRHLRHVFYLKPDLFIVADELTPTDDKSHTYEALFHLDTEAVTVDGLRVTTSNSGPNLTVIGFQADGVQIVKGQKEPVVQGWLPARAGGYGGIKPIPTAIFRKSAAGPVVMLYALCPTRLAADCPVRSVELAPTQLSVQFTDGQEKRIRFQPWQHASSDRPAKP